MTNPTPHGQVPAIQRYKIGYHSDEWGVRSSTPGGIYDDAGPWVRYEDHVTALAAGQATAAQADSVLEDAARLERERICAAIKAEDDYCVDHGDYMLDSDDCIKIVRGEWVRPDFAIDTARKQGGET